MKKDRKVQTEHRNTLSPEEAVRFLEDFRTLSANIDESSVAISIRIPANILRAVKLQAKAEGKKYQSLIVDYLRKNLQSKL